MCSLTYCLQRYAIDFLSSRRRFFFCGITFLRVGNNVSWWCLLRNGTFRRRGFGNVVSATRFQRWTIRRQDLSVMLLRRRGFGDRRFGDRIYRWWTFRYQDLSTIALSARNTPIRRRTFSATGQKCFRMDVSATPTRRWTFRRRIFRHGQFGDGRFGDVYSEMDILAKTLKKNECR